MKTLQQIIGNSMEPRLYQGQALRVCAVRTALTEPSLHAHPESGKGDGAAGAHPLTSGGAQVLGLIFKVLPTNSADEAPFSPLLTDLYRLTMLAGYLNKGMDNSQATFDLSYRINPFYSGYAVFAGLAPALACLEQLSFQPKEIDYLHKLGLFTSHFLDYLAAFRFRGSVVAPAEGAVVFANEPLVTVSGSLMETQLVETLLLNIINFQTLVATKAARICHAAGKAEVIEFGLRRAQGPDGGLSASRAACIGGANGTSNVLAGMNYGLPVRGTHAHSWVLAFEDELTAFRAYADTFPDSSVLLVDTYDTLKSGVPNAITVAGELRRKGHCLRGIMFDSGDLAIISREARRMLDEAGFSEVKIFASNELDEEIIDSIQKHGGRVDIFGVGTKLATAWGTGGVTLSGVYKLVAMDGQPTLKAANGMAKAILPGIKKVVRMSTAAGAYVQDLVCLEKEVITSGMTVVDLAHPQQKTVLPESVQMTDMRRIVMQDGHCVVPAESIDHMAARCRRDLSMLPEGCFRFVNPQRYKVAITQQLHHLREPLMQSVSVEKSGRS